MTGTLAVAVATILAAGPAHGAPGGPPVAISAGDYKAEPKLSEAATYAIGIFTVLNEDGRRQIVPTEDYDGIYYPDVGKCDDFSVPLTAAGVPVSAAGRFRIEEKIPVEDTFVKVDWKGRWTKAKRVAGTITIKHDGCTSTERWIGRRVPDGRPA